MKLGKHLALLVCLFILDSASGRYPVSQILILGLVVVSALLHSIGRGLQRNTRLSRLPWGGSV
jgi:hypothetical protein